MRHKYTVRATRDFVRVIEMGPLVIKAAGHPDEIIAAGETTKIPVKKDETFGFHTKKSMVAFVSTLNAEFPGAVEVVNT